MTYTPTRLLTVDDFVAQYADEAQYELADGELIDMGPTGPPETVGGKIATWLSIEIAQTQQPWMIPRTC